MDHTQHRPRLLPRLAAASAAVTVTAVMGGLATSQGTASAEYRSLDKPSWQPPGAVFPVVWTGLYASIAGASAVALTEMARHRGEVRRRERMLPQLRARRTRPSRRIGRRSRAFTAALGLNLALNAGWCWTFFRAQERELAVLNAAALTVSSADLVRRASAAHRGAGAALLPYTAWCGFATALSAAIADRNPTR